MVFCFVCVDYLVFLVRYPFTCVRVSVCWQDYRETTERISIELGRKMGPGPE